MSDAPRKSTHQLTARQADILALAVEQGVKQQTAGDRRTLAVLVREGLVNRDGRGIYRATDEGRARAAR